MPGDARSLIGPGRLIEPAVIQQAARAGSHRYPYAVWTPLPETATQPRIDTTTFILHSMAGPNLTSLEAITRYYMRDDITGEPTFALDMAGRACQYMATDQRADNNAQANKFAASVETQDEGAAKLPTTAWTAEQVAQLAGMSAFLNLAEGVPLARPKSWNGGGIDGHRAFPEWSIYVGKTCPGDARWAQIPLVIELAGEIVAWRPPPPPVTPPEEVDEMNEPPHPTVYLAYHLNSSGQLELWKGDGMRSERVHNDVRVAIEGTDKQPGRSFTDPRMRKFLSPWTNRPYESLDELRSRPLTASQLWTDLGRPQ